MHTRNRWIWYLLTFWFAATFGAAAQVPMITNVEPTLAHHGSVVQIHGANFSATAADNVVYFGAIRASVVSSTTSQLNVLVPKGGQYASLSLTSQNRTCYSPSAFDVKFGSDGIVNANTFKWQLDVKTRGTIPHSVAVGDLDEDASADLVVINNSDGSVTVFKNSTAGGSITFAEAGTYQVGTAPYGVSLGDLDGDGMLDMAVTSTQSSRVTIFKNTSVGGTISFAAMTTLNPAPGSVMGVVIRDIDMDGLPDIAVAQIDNNSVGVFRNQGTVGSTISFSPRMDYPARTNPYCLVIEDLDGDGKPDIVVSNAGENSISLFRNLSTPGSISFASSEYLITGDNAISVAAGDVDGDGLLDLAICNYTSNTVSLFRNQSSSGSVTFAPRIDLTTGLHPSVGIFADINGDGRPDLAFVDQDDFTFSVLVNQSTPGMISFTARIAYAVGGRAISLVVGDVDGDGKPDCLVSHYFSNTVSVFKNEINDPPPGNITGTVSMMGSPLTGVVVRLLDEDGLPEPGFDPQTTDASGHYGFLQVPIKQYQVMIVEPLGYTVDQNPKPATVTAGATTTVDFSLTQVAICNDARGKGYWKHQFDVYVTGKGHAQETSADLTGFIATVHERYTPHFGLFAGKTSFVDWQGILSPAKKASMLDKAKEHLAALVMNLVSLKIGQYTVVTADGRTAGDVLTYVSTLLSDADLSNDETAKDLAEAVNEQTTIAAGRVPVGSILYKGGVPPISWGTEVPRTFALHSAYPNPFNPSTTVEYDIPKATQVVLVIWNSLGQEVARLAEGYQEAGRYRVKWDARGMASGVYICSMKAGDFASSTKLLLVR